MSNFTSSLAPSWNPIGNALNYTPDVVATFGCADAPVTGVTSNVASVWKWDAANQGWAYYSPSLTLQQLIDFTSSRSHQVLASIGPGEGYWVNALAPLAVQSYAGSRGYLHFEDDSKTLGLGAGFWVNRP